MVEVKGRKVDMIAVTVAEANVPLDRAWFFRPVFDVSEVKSKEYIAKEIAKEVVEIVREQVDDEYYTELEQREDREAVEDKILYLLEEAPEDPADWMMILPSEVAYISVDFYEVTKKLKEVERDG